MRYNHFDMLPEKAFSPIGKRMTLEGGGGSGGGGTSTTQQGIDPMLKPYIETGLNEATRLYQTQTPQYFQGQTYVSPSSATTAALNAAQARATQGSTLLPAAQKEQQDVLSGKYLANNPYFNAAMGGASQAAQQNYFDAIAKAQSDASKSGRYGSGASADIQNRAATTMANTLANKYGELAYSNYAAERGAQNAAATAAPALAQADYTDIGQLYNVGQQQEQYQQQALQDQINRWNFQQNLPQNQLNQYLSQVYGAPMGTTSTTTQQSSGGKIVCTMMNESYGIGSFRNRVWLAHSASMPNAKTYEKGYHTLFLPLVAFAKKDGFFNRIVKSALEHIAKHRTADIYKEMRGNKRDTLGRIYRAVLEPICYAVGKMKGK